MDLILFEGRGTNALDEKATLLMQSWWVMSSLRVTWFWFTLVSVAG